MKDDISNIKFEQIRLFNKSVLFTPSRINSKNLPKGIYKYEVRSDDEGLGIICELAKSIKVNFWGTILSNRPIQLDQDGYREISEENDIQFINQPNIAIPKYLSKTHTHER